MTYSKSTIIPGLMYRDAPAAIDWLCRVFSFTRHAVYEGEAGTIMHAELTLNGGMLMLGSTKEHAPPYLSSGVSLIVPDADEVYVRVQAAKAEITLPIEDKPYGGRGFSCKDPEGNAWHIGTYDPWAPK